MTLAVPLAVPITYVITDPLALVTCATVLNAVPDPVKPLTWTYEPLPIPCGDDVVIVTVPPDPTADAIGARSIHNWNGADAGTYDRPLIREPFVVEATRPMFVLIEENASFPNVIELLTE